MSGPSLNKMTIIGHLGADPESRTVGQTSVTNVRIATSESWKDKQSGEKKERTEWHSVSFWGRLGEVVQQYLKKGSLIYVEGKLQTRKWQDKNGVDRYTTEIIADEMKMLGGKPGAQRAAAPDKAATGAAALTDSHDDFDDDADIPF